jgi:hypothetical protein
MLKLEKQFSNLNKKQLMTKLRDYIRESSSRAQKRKRYFFLFGNVPVYVKEPITNGVDIINVLKTVEESVPRSMAYNLEMIVVGNMPEFERMGTNAMFKDGTIYIINEQDDEADMVDDIVHELAHSVETFAGAEIYGDGLVEQEFLRKRTKMFDILNSEGYNIPARYFLDTEFDEDFDAFLYQIVGYPMLMTLTMGIFISPYAMTSLREYWARGFENYYIKDRAYLAKISPVLYNKIEELEIKLT